MRASVCDHLYLGEVPGCSAIPAMPNAGVAQARVRERHDIRAVPRGFVEANAELHRPDGIQVF